MRRVKKWLLVNGTYMALTDDNVLVGYIKPVNKPFNARNRPPDAS